MFVSFMTRGGILAAVGVCVVAVSSCGDSSSPTSPSPPAAQTPPTQPGPPPAQAAGAVQIAINPNPVPHSGVPIADAPGCKDVRYTWYYDQVFQETGGSAVTFTQRIDLFDDRETNNISNLNLVVPANGTNTIRSRWCSSAKAAHSAQTRWTGTDAAGRTVSVLGPRVTLSAPQ